MESTDCRNRHSTNGGQRFSDGRTSVTDDELLGRSVSAADDETFDLVEAAGVGRSVLRLKVSFFTGISIGSVHVILHKKLRWRTSVLIECRNTSIQIKKTVALCKKLLKLNEEQGGEFLGRMSRGHSGESFHFHESKAKKSSMQWKCPDSPRSRKFRIKTSAKKVLNLFYWEFQGSIFQWPVKNVRYFCYWTLPFELDARPSHAALKKERRGRITAGVLF